MFSFQLVYFFNLSLNLKDAINLSTEFASAPFGFNKKKLMQPTVSLLNSTFIFENAKDERR